MLHPGSANALLPRSTEAQWAGTIDFADCGSKEICFHAHTHGALDACYDTVGAGNLQVTLSGCEADVEGEVTKAIASGAPVCAGTGTATLFYTDFLGTTIPIPVVVLVSNGGIVIEGRYVDAAGHEIYSVYATGSGACAVSPARWAGTLTAYNY